MKVSIFMLKLLIPDKQNANSIKFTNFVPVIGKVFTLSVNNNLIKPRWKFVVSKVQMYIYFVYVMYYIFPYSILKMWKWNSWMNVALNIFDESVCRLSLWRGFEGSQRGVDDLELKANSPLIKRPPLDYKDIGFMLKTGTMDIHVG